VNNNTSNNNININNGGWGGGNWGGGGWNNNWGGGSWNNNWGGGGWNNNWGGGGWYGPTVNNNFFGPGWSGANWGNWYHGGWGNNFWAGFGTGALTTWGLNALFRPSFAYSTYGYLPPAWAAPVYGSWGLGAVASDWMYGGYANPYATGATQTVIVQQPVPVAVDGGAAAPAQTQQMVVYDYSQPIDTTAAPAEPTKAEAAQNVFESARTAFKGNDFARALALADQALVDLPNDPVIHEFRALALFALGRFDEAAAVAYAVLSNGPGWDWTTLVGLYSGVDAYTAQVRNLEAYVKQNPGSAPGQFLLAYHYIVQGHRDAAGKQFAKVAQIEPKDVLSAQLAKAFGAADQIKAQQAQASAPGAAAPGQPAQQAAVAGSDGAPAEGEAQAPPPPPEELAGTWTAKPDDKVTITLTLSTDGTFSWAVAQGGQTQTIQGQAGFQDEVLALGQEQGPPLVGKVTWDATKSSFTFRPPGAPESVQGLTFQRAQG
jgi:hypothetical protein